MFDFLDSVSSATLSNAVTTFSGKPDVLSGALGALAVGSVYGWRYLGILHSPMTLKDYQAALQLEFKVVLPEFTDFSMRSNALRHWKQTGCGYWSIVLGHVAVDDRRGFTDLNIVPVQANIGSEKQKPDMSRA